MGGPAAVAPIAPPRQLGRWLSRDSLAKAEVQEGPNLYAYVGNNPINALDPLGLCCEEIQDAMDSLNDLLFTRIRNETWRRCQDSLITTTITRSSSRGGGTTTVTEIDENYPSEDCRAARMEEKSTRLAIMVLLVNLGRLYDQCMEQPCDHYCIKAAQPLPPPPPPPFQPGIMGHPHGWE